jgi:hypothetical protein
MKVKKVRLLFLLLIVVLLSGCMYPNDRKMENQLPLSEQVKMVQEGIDKFYADKEILPILTKEMDTPIFEKYVIDFPKMIPRYIPYIPGAAFEKGGHDLFVLTHVETKPTVKLLDLTMVDKVTDVQARVSYYFQERKSLPVGGVIQPGYFLINFKELAMGQNQGTVVSPYTGQPLPLIMSSKGVVGVDFTKDLEQFLKGNKPSKEAMKDLRYLAADNSLYVPAKSFPYVLKDGKPVLVTQP